MKYFLVFLLVVLVGIGSFKMGQTHPLNAAEDASNVETRVKEDLIALTRKDFEEYQKLKTLEERYQKADEILGKIVVLFLADLGSRLAYRPAPPAEVNKVANEVAAEIGRGQPPAARSPVSTPTPDGAASSVGVNSQWQNHESSVSRLQDDQSAFASILKLSIPDIPGVVSGSRGLRPREAALIEGRFVGEIKFIKHDIHKSDWNLEWEVVLSNSLKVEGSGYILISDKADGKQLSRTRFGPGSLKDFMKPSGSRAMIINVYGDDGYVQLYPLGNDSSVWGGNYYEKKKDGKFELIGQARVTKVN
ncbi:MAG: hypothetical protein H7326_00040 [Bdellovibrionaceae bacterium]|nr:hypothetical protein [Pseudobdellovibrionaceae bacterium]